MASDTMGRYAFDGAEGYAFHIYEDDTQETLLTSVRFDELEEFKAFLVHNLPGLFDAHEYEYGTRRRLSESAHSPDTFSYQAETSEANARDYVAFLEEMRPGAAARVEVVRRTKPGEWEKVDE